MRIWCLADPHLSFGTANKEMSKFGENWRDHAAQIQSAWREVVEERDLVLVPGDISWALRLSDALVDLEFLAALPGRKILCRGNHDYWWSSLTKVRAALPTSLFAINGDAIGIDGVALAGTRLWDVPGLDFSAAIEWRKDGDELSANVPRDVEQIAEDLRIYQRELERLKRSLVALDELRRVRQLTDRPSDGVKLSIVLCHYPPVSADLAENELSALFEAHKVDHVVFGHLHALKPGRLFGTKNGVGYHLCSCDYLRFQPRLIAEI
ncbi:MAG: metallophosphoesterase [Planctomycetota bacterium]